jgi:2-aminoethylphosphonate-pyruvate transaminase
MESPDKILFTPGPLTTSATVKLAMLRDLGSRDNAFIKVIKEIRAGLLELGEVDSNQYTSIIMQGSGTFGIESVISSTIPKEGKLAVIINGAYGKRIAHIASVLKIETEKLVYPEDKHPSLAEIDNLLANDKKITHVAVVHCETTTGIFNPIKEIGEIVRKHGRKYFVDAMSSFGAVPTSIAQCEIDYLVSSSNKCIEGVPGFSFVIARKTSLLETEGYARSVSLDLYSQWKEIEASGQFRFTPPTHALLAFHQALTELREEGGVEGRARRYQNNFQTLMRGMRELGFQEYLRPQDQGYIINTFLYPSHPKFEFKTFYEKLNDKGFVIYPGKLTTADCFRIGNIGRITEKDICALLEAINKTMVEMGISLN